MAIIRQEINILDALLSAAGGASATSSEIVHLNTGVYNGATFYFEIVADSTLSISFNVTLNGATDGTLATCNVPLLTTAYTLFRSASFTPATAAQNCTVIIDNTAGATKNVKSARIVIIQNASSFTGTETQIEVGGTSGSTTTSTVSVPITNPKYWKYTSANWDGTVTVYFEAVFKSGTSKSAATASLQVADGSGDGFVNWTDVTSSPITTTATVATRVRSGAITLTAGRNYRAAFKCASSKSATTIYNAKVILNQSNSTKLEPQYLLLNTITPSGTGLQTYFTKWDSAEWSGVTNTYTGQAESANGSTSDVEIWEADGGGSAIATITNPDNAGTGAATMPTSQNLDYKCTTNGVDIYGVRILVTVSVDPAVGSTLRSWGYEGGWF